MALAILSSNESKNTVGAVLLFIIRTQVKYHHFFLRLEMMQLVAMAYFNSVTQQKYFLNDSVGDLTIMSANCSWDWKVIKRNLFHIKGKVRLLGVRWEDYQFCTVNKKWGIQLPWLCLKYTLLSTSTLVGESKWAATVYVWIKQIRYDCWLVSFWAKHNIIRL